MTAPFPHHYRVAIRRGNGVPGYVEASPRPAIAGGPPPEFDGQEQWWSPEHLLLASASLCLMTTFLAVAGKSKLEVLGYSGAAEGTLDKTPEGMAFTTINHMVALVVPAGDVEKGERLLQTAKKHCLLTNSLKAAVTLAATVSAATTDQARAT